MTEDASAGHPCVHVMPIRIYYEDTDAGGVVYHAGYLRFAERARTEMLRSLGFQQSQLLEREGIAFVVTRCEVDFRASARLDDMLEVATRLTEIGAASLRFSQHFRRDGREMVCVVTRVACIGRNGRPARLPEAVRHRIAEAAAVGLPG